MAGASMRDIIVVLPGILGSTLQKNGKDVWKLSPGAILRGLVPGGAGIEDLALGEDPPDLDDLSDGVVVTGMFRDAHLIPGLWKIDGYTRVTDYIRRAFDVTPGKNFFEFPYDWRRDNRVAARRLGCQAREWLQAWRASTGDPGARIILVAHSMGGLVSRYFLEVLGGWVDTRALITFGTPYRGSLNALNMLSNGFSKGLGPVSLIDLSEFVRTLTSVHQLLPVYPCYDCGDRELVRIADASTPPPNLDVKRVRDALAFHHEIRDKVSEHQNDPKYRSEGYKIFPIVGTHQRTLQSAFLEADGTLSVIPEYEGRDLDGDGTVPCVSATPIELSQEQREFFAAQKHGSLQNADASCIQLEGVLKFTQLNLSMFRAPQKTMVTENRLRLLVEDSYEVEEPVQIRVQPEVPSSKLDAAVVNLDTSERHTLILTARSNGIFEGQATGLNPGTYRVTVSGSYPTVPISDLFVVS